MLWLCELPQLTGWRPIRVVEPSSARAHAAGDEDSASRKAVPGTRARRAAVMVDTVAVLGTEWMRPISPK